jgi:hypothetical protein
VIGAGRPRSLDLAIACGLAALGLLVSIVSPEGWSQAVALAPLVLAAPGYAITAALFPPGAVDRAELVVYSFVFSVSASALGGLALQVVLGLDRTAWLVLLVLLTLAASTIAQARRDALPIQSARKPAMRLPAGPLWAVAILAALASAGGAIGIGAEGVREQLSRQRFASLWAVPIEADVGSAGVKVGVRNHGGPAAYRLEVRSAGEIVERRRLRLAPDQLWEARLGPEVTADSGSLLVTLYHASTPYRSVELNIGEGL